MKQVASADFRKAYSSETEPVEVTSYGKVIGVWFPAGSDTSAAVAATAVETVEEKPEQRMTIRPAHGPKPRMTETVKPVLDPVELRKLERERYSEFQARMYGPKGGRATSSRTES